MRLAAVVLFLSSFACAQDTQSGLTRAGLSILLIFVCALFVLWALFLTFYNTRFLGWLGSLLLRWYLRTKEKRIYLDFGSLSFNIFAAKLSFREVRYVTKDHAITIVDGYILFRYWATSYSTSLSDKTSCRLIVQVNGLTYHVFNNTGKYESMRDILKGLFNPETVERGSIDHPVDDEPAHASNPLESFLFRAIPVIKIHIGFGRFIAGNVLLPSTLVAYFRRASLYYTLEKLSGVSPTTPSWDKCMRVLQGKFYKFRAKIHPTLAYEKKAPYPEQAPMKKKDWHLQPTDVEILCRYTVPGLVTVENINSAPPKCEMDIRFVKGIDIVCSGAINAQRIIMQRFFFPPTYQDMEPTPEPRVVCSKECIIFEGFVLSTTYF